MDTESHVVVAPLRFIDRSRITTDWACPRRRYWQYEFGGRGIQPDVTSLELFLGTALHDGLASIGDATRETALALSTGEPEGSRGSVHDAVDIDAIPPQAQGGVYESLGATPGGGVPGLFPRVA